jgi:tRNA G26 N,N-dimethylase Trm1
MQKELAKKKMKQEKRIGKLLFLTENEAEAPPTYYVIDKICDRYGLPAPSTKNIVKQLEKIGHATVSTHFHQRGIKTNASAKTIREIIMKEVKSARARKPTARTSYSAG